MKTLFLMQSWNNSAFLQQQQNGKIFSILSSLTYLQRKIEKKHGMNVTKTIKKDKKGKKKKLFKLINTRW